MSSLAERRLIAHGLTSPGFASPHEMVSRFGAVQAQEYLAALWAVGMRVARCTEADVRRAIEDRRIVRGWPMRGTLHFTAAEDTRWILELTAPRQIASAGPRSRQLELDERAYASANDAMAAALTGHKRLSRPQLFKALERAGVSPAGQRGAYLLFRAVADRVICQVGVERGKGVYMLFDEALPSAKSLPRDAALAELALRYFASHGPATVHDFAWWSGLTVADARAGIEANSPRLILEHIDGKDYWSDASEREITVDSPVAHLLPMYDEYLVAYKDRSAVVPHGQTAPYKSGNPVFSWVILIDGRTAGTWKRTLRQDSVVVDLSPAFPLTDVQRDAVHAAARRFGEFLGLEPTVA
jgi:hypothetical protein